MSKTIFVSSAVGGVKQLYEALREEKSPAITPFIRFYERVELQDRILELERMEVYAPGSLDGVNFKITEMKIARKNQGDDAHLSFKHFTSLCVGGDFVLHEAPQSTTPTERRGRSSSRGPRDNDARSEGNWRRSSSPGRGDSSYDHKRSKSPQRGRSQSPSRGTNSKKVHYPRPPPSLGRYHCPPDSLMYGFKGAFARTSMAEFLKQKGVIAKNIAVYTHASRPENRFATIVWVPATAKDAVAAVTLPTSGERAVLWTGDHMSKEWNFNHLNASVFKSV